ncbi:hypothetical protein TNCV_1941381 [Trichonephila clavipes]|uniref:Uncharacterized protein n=1 Tax=Trichonephila clavipes TaxID=2585209 RepID=A0A8X6SDB1_TRICX|nr:hypothetical protein TNCV_1941381 [Trichonephila clavipes]
MTVNVPGFDLRSFGITAKHRRIATTSSVAVSLSSSHKASGVTLYRNINSFINSSGCNRVIRCLFGSTQ